MITFVAGTPFEQLDTFSLTRVQQYFSPPPPLPTPAAKSPEQPKVRPNAITGEVGGSSSGKIRLFVWEGAIAAWKQHVFFGTGVETFAFAYYKYKPIGHNLTSEWDYLYNKAHNEYLNYLTTTGAFGLGSYFLVISIFLFLVLKQLKTTDQKSKLDKKLLPFTPILN